jgi:hypothetical protein
MNQWEIAAEAGMIDPGSMVGVPVDLWGVVVLLALVALLMWVLPRSFLSTE